MSNNQFTSFLAGILIISLSISLPVEFLDEQYLFSAHMVIHVLLLLVAAPLLVLSIPANSISKNWFIKLSKSFYQWPILCWFTGIGIMWFWHIPVVYRHLMEHHTWHVLQHTVSWWNLVHLLSLLLAGIIFSWVVIGPYPQYRLAPLTGIFYLVTACMGCSLLGLLITFAPNGMYEVSVATNCGPGFAGIINNKWTLSQTTDRQMAGLIMWVPGCFIYLTGVLFLLRQWFLEKDESGVTNLHFQNT